MGTKTVRLDEDVYEWVRARKRSDETFSDAIDRQTGGASLLDPVGVFDDERVSQLREAVEEADELDRTETEALGECFE